MTVPRDRSWWKTALLTGWRPYLGERIHNIFLSLTLTIVGCVNVGKSAAECMNFGWGDHGVAGPLGR
jgi:hypothetical protein